MAYTKEQVVAWLNERWKGQKQCSVCESNNWSVSDTPVEMRPYQGGGLVVGGPVYPLFSITCLVCGHTMLFNAIVSGIVSKEQPQEAKAEVGADLKKEGKK